MPKDKRLKRLMAEKKERMNRPLGEKLDDRLTKPFEGFWERWAELIKEAKEKREDRVDTES